MADVAIHVVLAVATLAMAGCDHAHEELPEYVLAGQVMGTTYSVKLVAPRADTDFESLGTTLDDRLQSIDERMSTYKPDSELSRFNKVQSEDWVAVSQELCAVIERATRISIKTDGAFDITVGPLVDLWGFGAAGDRDDLPTADEAESTLARVGYERLETDCSRPAIRKEREDLSVDLSAFAKGYAVDEAAELLVADNQDNFLVEIGGELRMRGVNAAGKRWAIAIESPVSESRSVDSVLNLTDAAVATSGDYRNYYEIDGQQYSHTIDPDTGKPVTHNGAAVTVVTGSAADADALATALLVMGPETGLAFATAEDLAAYFLLRTDDRIEHRATAAFTRLTNQ